MTRGECWARAHAETVGLPSFLLHRERDRRFAELCAAAGDPPCLVARVPVIPLSGSIVGGDPHRERRVILQVEGGTALSLIGVDPTWGWGLFVARCTYRPNARLSVYPGPTLIVELDVLDTYTRCQVTVAHRLPLPSYPMTDADRAEALRRILHQVEMHEADEWLRVDGIVAFDPHALR